MHSKRSGLVYLASCYPAVLISLSYVVLGYTELSSSSAPCSTPGHRFKVTLAEDVTMKAFIGLLTCPDDTGERSEILRDGEFVDAGSKPSVELTVINVTPSPSIFTDILF